MEQLRDEKYVLMTTWRKSGKAVPTPIWFATDAGKVYVWTPREAGKVKRIRAGSPVELQACDARGKETHGEAFRGTAKLLDGPETDRVRGLLKRKYGVLGAITVYGSILRGGKDRTLGVEITLDAA